MDEPTANLDFGNQGLILDEIARLRAAGAAVLFSTHHPITRSRSPTAPSC
jgi:iron complex transport system ATP-binding protein